MIWNVSRNTCKTSAVTLWLTHKSVAFGWVFVRKLWFSVRVFASPFLYHVCLKLIKTKISFYTVSKKIWGMHTVPHNSHKNRALWMKFGTVNRKSISYNISLKLLMQRSTSCSHCHDSVCFRCGHTSVRPSLMTPSMSGRSDFWHAYKWRDVIFNIWCKLNVR